jgi:hypothetical protein
MGVRGTAISVAGYGAAALFVIAGLGAGMLFAASVAPTPDPPATVSEPVSVSTTGTPAIGPDSADERVGTDDTGPVAPPDGPGDGSPPTPTPTFVPEATLTSTPTTPTVPPNVTVSGDTRQFTFTITAIDECGSRCRDVTARLENTGDAVSDVSLESTLYAGGAGDDAVWSDTQRVGDLDAESSTTVTSRISVGYLDGAKLCGADRATMVTTVQSTDHEQTFTTHPEVC